MDQTDVLFRSLAIALVIVAPYAIYKVRQVRRRNGAVTRGGDGTADRAEGPHNELPALEDVIRDIGFVEEEAGRNGGALLVVPHTVTVSDRPAPPELVDTLVRDALRRSNLLITAEMESDEGRILECAPAVPLVGEVDRSAVGADVRGGDAGGDGVTGQTEPIDEP